jgi:hypothetical protein
LPRPNTLRPNIQRPVLGWDDLEPLANVQPRTNIQPQPTIQPRVNSQPRRPCLYFARGHCNKGAACRFSHDKNNIATIENQV